MCIIQWDVHRKAQLPAHKGVISNLSVFSVCLPDNAVTLTSLSSSRPIILHHALNCVVGGVQLSKLPPVMRLAAQVRSLGQQSHACFHLIVEPLSLCWMMYVLVVFSCFILCLTELYFWMSVEGYHSKQQHGA